MTAQHALAIACIAVFARCRAVDSAVLVVAHAAVVLQDVEDPRHLGEDEDSVALFLELFEKLVEENELEGGEGAKRSGAKRSGAKRSEGRRR